MVAVSAMLIMLGMLSLLYAGISIKDMGISIPVIFVSSAIGYAAQSGLITQDGFINLLLIAYMVLTVIAVALSFLSVFMIITRRRAGVTAGIVSAMIAAVMGIVMIIAVFIAGNKIGITLAPSVWLWLSVPINLLSAVFLFIEGDDIV